MPILLEFRAYMSFFIAYSRVTVRHFTVVVFITSAKKVMFSSLVVCLSACLLATLCKNLQTDLHEIFREGWQWTSEQMIKFFGDLEPICQMVGLISRHW